MSEGVERGFSALKLSSDEANFRAQMAETYAENIASRVFPALGDLTSDQRASLRSTAECAGPDSAADLENEMLSDVGDLFQQVMGVAFIGLYSQWERTVKTILERETKWCRDKLIPDAKLKKLDFDGLSKLLNRIGWTKSKPVYRDLRLLHCIACVVKHGDGTSLQKIEEDFRNIFPTIEAGSQIDAEFLEAELTPELFMHLADSVASFWRGLPSC